MKCKVLVASLLQTPMTFSAYLSIHLVIVCIIELQVPKKSSDSHAHEQYTALWKILTIANGNANTKFP